jgi:catechol 2,3-dioxygenase-like lactoylglutathione lyase family enzyme
MDSQLFATLPASDIDRAKAWYAEKLGLEPSETGGDGSLFYMWGDSRLLVYPSEFAGTNQATAAGFVVEDFESAAAEIRENGVIFEEYDFGEDMHTEEGVYTDPDGRRGAFFKDSEGNILALTEDPRAGD